MGTSIAREQGGERADFKQSSIIPRGIELFNLPMINAGVVPGLGFVMLSLVLLRPLLHEPIAAILIHSSPSNFSVAERYYRFMEETEAGF